MTRHASTLLLAVIGILAIAATAAAQEAAATSFDALGERLRIGQSIWVTDRRDGKFVASSSGSRTTNSC